ncbi:phage tail protein [Parvularcula flava]|uniref:Phage tail protein n=1 Tax=Aquisalinus luteolus TaxID=1566827 RepID=A0A8J3ET95_9PROT|nr:tail fiber protein [Aquisalinus luteolus]NHK26727.1 phage tail protein [Aquisalinus luteolus]GGH93234.1 tail Collar domain-containing protein [Aquisalinus luteolus]
MRIKAAAVTGAMAIAIGGLSSIAPAAAQPESFTGQLMLTGYNFCPQGWAPAEGQLIAISENPALFSLYGTYYGGNGQTTFGLPDLRGRVPIHYGTGPGLPTYQLGEAGGTTSFTLTIPQMPSHDHRVNTTNQTADQEDPDNRYLAGGVGDDDMYHDGPPNREMAADMVGQAGDNEPVDHRGPYTAMQWCVSLQDIFPPRN